MTRRLVVGVVWLALFGWMGTVLADQAANKAKEEKAKQEQQEYYELYKSFADAVDQVERNYVKDVSRRELIEAAIRGMLSKLDPYSNYISPEDIDRFKTSVESQFGGIGIQIDMEERPAQGPQPAGRHAGLQGRHAGGRPHPGDRRQEHRGHHQPRRRRQQAQGRSRHERHADHLAPGQPHAGEGHDHARSRPRARPCWASTARPTTAGTSCSMRTRRSATSASPASAATRPTISRRRIKDLESQKLRGLILDLRFNPGGLLTSADRDLPTCSSPTGGSSAPPAATA